MHPNNKRSCNFRLWKRDDGLGDAQPGVFHTWGTKLYEDDKGFHETTVAIVEDKNGQVHEVEPSHILFTDHK